MLLSICFYATVASHPTLSSVSQHEQVAAALCMPQQRPLTNYERIITQPNQFNGYESYIRATDMVHGTHLSLLLFWSPTQYDEALNQKKIILSGGSEAGSKEWGADDEANLALIKRYHDAGYLGVQQTVLRDFGVVLDLVRDGNLKKVWDPRETLNATTVFPELADFKQLARLACATGYAKFASGDSSGGTNDLLVGLVFSRKIAGGNLISELVSIACSSIVFGQFQDRLAQLSDKDAQQIINVADAALAEPSSYVTSLQRERLFAVGSLSQLLEDPSVLTGRTDDPDPLAKYAKSLSPSEKRRAKQGLEKRIDDYYSKLVASISGEESSWLGMKDDDGLPPAPNSIATIEDFEDALMNMITPVHSQATLAVLRCRAQLRLLDLHAHIIDFRWKNNRLPSDLREAAPDSLITDPLTKSSFVYEVKDDGYRLLSKGLDVTGPIELKYKRPANLPKPNDDPIPPRL